MTFVGLYYDQNCHEDSRSTITDGFVFQMNFTMWLKTLTSTAYT